MTESAIKAEGLGKEFIPAKKFGRFLRHPWKKEKSAAAVRDVTLAVPAGKIFSLVGPNGAGKTTLLKMLCSLVTPTAGRAWVNGYDVVREEEKAKNSAGLVSGDERSFYWRLTGRENLHFFASLRGMRRKKTEEKIRDLSVPLQLSGFLDKRFQEYSTGMKQRLGLARSLLSDPPVLFLDEPTRSLDAKGARTIHRFILDELVSRKKKTVFYITHLLKEAEDFSDYLGIMVKGSLVIRGEVSRIKQKHPGKNGLEEIYRLYAGDDSPGPQKGERCS